MASGTVEYRDGVKVVVGPDGAVYRYADVQRYNNPGMDFDDATGEPLAMVPTIEDRPAAEARSLGSQVGNEDLAAGRALALDPSTSLYSLLDPEGRYANTPLGYVNQAIMRAPDLVLGGLLAGGGALQKAAGYGSDALGLGLSPGDIPNTEEVGQLADALYALPASRMLGSISEAGGRAAALDLARRTTPPQPSVPTAGAPAFGEGWEDVYHWSRSPTDFEAFDPDKSTGGLSRLGPHVGTKQAAEDRFAGLSETSGAGFTLPLKANLSRPFVSLNTGQPWPELDLEMLLSRIADENNMDRRDVAPFMRQRLAEQGYTHIPYINDVEDPGSVSNIMLTDRGGKSDAVLRSRFAAFDPRRARAEDLSAAIIAGAPMGLLSMQEGPQ